MQHKSSRKHATHKTSQLHLSVDLWCASFAASYVSGSLVYKNFEQNNYIRCRSRNFSKKLKNVYSHYKCVWSIYTQKNWTIYQFFMLSLIPFPFLLFLLCYQTFFKDSAYKPTPPPPPQPRFRQSSYLLCVSLWFH